MIERKRWRLAGNRRGQSIFLVAIGIVVFCGFLALVLDVARLYFAKQRLHNHCDASALAGVLNLPDSSSDAKTTAAEYYRTNIKQDYVNPTTTWLSDDANTSKYTIGGDTVWITTPYQDSYTLSKGMPPQNVIEVRSERTVSFYVATVLGLWSSVVGSRSVAAIGGVCGCGTGYGGGTTGYAVWSDNGNDRDLVIHGGRNRIEGDAHTNRTYTVTGNNHTVTGKSEYVAPGPTVQGTDHSFTFGQVAAGLIPQPPHDFAYYKAMAQAAGTYYTEDKKFSGKDQVVNGVIVVEGGDIEISGEGAGGTCTLIATGQVRIASQGSVFRAQVDKLLMWSGALGGWGQQYELNISAASNNDAFYGVCYSAGARFDLSGHDHLFVGSVIAQQIEITGSDNVIRWDSNWGWPGQNMPCIVE